MLLFQFPEAEEILRQDDWALLREWAASHPDLERAIADLERPGALTARSTGTARTCIRAASSQPPRRCRRSRPTRSGSGAAATTTCSSTA